MSGPAGRSAHRPAAAPAAGTDAGIRVLAAAAPPGGPAAPSRMPWVIAALVGLVVTAGVAVFLVYG